MTKPKLISLLAGFGLLVFLVPVIFVVTLDLNQYKSLMVDVVKKETGRDLLLLGPMEKSLFPWLGVKLGEASLGNASGFEHQEVFAGFEKAEVKVKFWPLMQGRLEVDKVVLHGFQLNLHTDKKGRSNFQDLLEKSESSSAESHDKPQEDAEQTGVSTSLADFSVGGLDFANAHIRWQDDQSGQRFEVKQFNMRTSAIKAQKPVDFDLSMQLLAIHTASTQPESTPQSATINLKGQLSVDPAQQSAQIKGLQLTAGLGKGVLPLDIKEVRVNTDLAVSDQYGKPSTLKASNLTIGLAGLQLSGGVKVKNTIQAALKLKVSDASRFAQVVSGLSGQTVSEQSLSSMTMKTKIDFNPGSKEWGMDMPLELVLPPLAMTSKLKLKRKAGEPHFQGSLAIAQFNPLELINRLGLKLPEGMDAKKSLQHFQLAMSFQGNGQKISVKPLKLELDDARLSGQVSVALPQTPERGPVLNYRLKMNRFNLDRYLPPAPEKPQETAEAAPQVTEQEAALPLEFLRRFSIDGRFDLDDAVLNGLKMKNLKTGIKGEGGVYTVKPLSVDLYGGTASAVARLDVRRDQAQWWFEEEIKQVHFGPLLKDASGEDLVSGVANMKLTLKGEGLSPDKGRDKINGELRFHFKDGNAKYLNVMDMLSKDYAKYLKKAVKKQPTDATVFSKLSGTAKIENGVVKNKDLLLVSSPIEVKGRGTANLVSEQLDFVLDATIVKPTKGMKAIKLDELKGEPIPIKIYGSFMEPKHKIDFGAVLKRKADKAIDRKKTKLKDKAKKSVQKRKEEVKEKAKEKMKAKSKKALDKLKDKFKF